jgi:hypothetical protein
MVASRIPGSLGVGANKPDADSGFSAKAGHHLAGTLAGTSLMMFGPIGMALRGSYAVAQFYYRANLEALATAHERAVILAPGAIVEATGMNDLGRLLGALLYGLIAALIGLAATTALGGVIGGVIGFFFGGVGAAPGAVVGAKIGLDVGLAVLTWLGVGFLAVSIGEGIGELSAMLTQGIQRAWAAGDKHGMTRDSEIEAAARELAKAMGLLVRLILEGIVVYLMRGAPMATTRTAAASIGQVRAVGADAVAAETVAELVAQLRSSRLGKGFADWVELNWRKLLANPKLRRAPAGRDGAAGGGAPGRAQTPSQTQGRGRAAEKEPAKTVKPPLPATREIKDLPQFKDMSKTQIEQQLAERGYSRVPSNDGTGSVWTKAGSDGNTAAVRLDDAIIRNPPKNFADEVPHLHKEVVSTSELINGNYAKPAIKFDDMGNIVTGPNKQTANLVHIPIKW